MSFISYSFQKTRRKFLQNLAYGTSGMLISPLISRAAKSESDSLNINLSNKRLIILELSGGNDALNTLVPYKNPLYARYRPTIGLKKNELTPITDYFGLNKSLSNLVEYFNNGEVAIIPDAGFAEADLSHFNCSNFWNSAGLNEAGWVGNTIQLNRELVNKCNFDAHGIILGGSPLMMKGNNIEYLTISGSRSMFNSQHFEKPIQIDKTNPGISHLASTINNYIAINYRIKQKLVQQNRFNSWFDYGDSFGAQISSLLWLIDSDVRSPVFKVSLSGFDMHEKLRENHETILSRLDNALETLRRGLKEIGVWNNTIVLIHSEFGRRPAENASLGTDHGSSSPILLIGGKITGGLYGQPSDLENLDVNGNTKFTTDFRQVYASIIHDFWQLKQDSLSQPKSQLLKKINYGI